MSEKREARTQEAVLSYWFGELTSPNHWDESKAKLWFMGGDDVDEEIKQCFGTLHEEIVAGEHEDWLETSHGSLAYILVLDQFSRNIHRGTAEAFSADEQARRAALGLIERGGDKDLYPIQRVFVYMPLEHSESLELQDHCVALFEGLEEDVSEEICETFSGYTGYAVKHRDIIAEFGRFPHRNDVLGRVCTEQEIAYLDGGGETFGQKKKS